MCNCHVSYANECIYLCMLALCVHIIGIAQSSEIIKYFLKNTKSLNTSKEERQGRQLQMYLVINLHVYNCLLSIPSGNSLCYPDTNYVTHIFAWLCV